MSIIEDFWSKRQELYLRKHIAPENRGIATLMQSRYVMRGQILRFVIDGKPRIVINADDVTELRYIMLEKSPHISIQAADQIIADIGEQLFAEWEAKQS